MAREKREGRHPILRVMGPCLLDSIGSGMRFIAVFSADRLGSPLLGQTGQLFRGRARGKPVVVREKYDVDPKAI
jgi:hypothetical protein